MTGWAPTSQLLILLVCIRRMVTGRLYCNLLLTTGFLQIEDMRHKIRQRYLFPCDSCNLQSSHLKYFWHFSSGVFQIWGALIYISANGEIKWSRKPCISSAALMIIKNTPQTFDIIEINTQREQITASTFSTCKCRRGLCLFPSEGQREEWDLLTERTNTTALSTAVRLALGQTKLGLCTQTPQKPEN